MKTTGFRTEALDTRAFDVPAGQVSPPGDVCEDAPAPKAGVYDTESEPQ